MNESESNICGGLFIALYDEESLKLYLDKGLYGFLMKPVMTSMPTAKSRYYAILADYANDYASSKYHIQQNKWYSDSIANNKKRYSIQHIENVNNSTQRTLTKQKNNTLQSVIISIALIFTILAIFFSYLHHRRTSRLRAIITELEHSTIDKHEILLNQLDAKDSLIGDCVQRMITFMMTSIETSEKDSPAAIRKRIKQIVSETVNDDFWNELRFFLDKKHNNIISKISDNSLITKKDIRFIELLCCGFSYIEIAIIMDYNPKYFSQKRIEIAKKLNLDVPLQVYLDSLMNN